MGHKFAEIAFTESVRDVQREMGSRGSYAGMEQGEDFNNVLGTREMDFVRARDSFYVASVSESGWPYVQHRGGPAGFMRIVDQQTLGFADFSGNRQYVSVGNFRKDNRISLFFMDYPNRTRLKMLGRVRLVDDDEPELLAKLEMDNYRADVERGFLIHIEAFDWNCPQHITPRFTESQIEAQLLPLTEEIRLLKSGTVRKSTQIPDVIGEGALGLVVSAIHQRTARIRSYELRTRDGSTLPAVAPGSHLQIPVLLTNGERVVRHYSVSSNPQNRAFYEITVLREDEGTGGSQAVHEIFDLGLKINCDLPENNFHLHEDTRPAVLIAGGVGITPLKAMAHELQSRAGEMHLHYAGRSDLEMAFRQELQHELDDDITLYRSDNGERINIEQIMAAAPANAVFYICGPGGLIEEAVNTAAKMKIDSHRLRYERFTATIHDHAKPITVELSRSGKTIQVSDRQTILEAMLQEGIDAPFSCRAGNCRTCAVKVLDGKPDHRDSALSEADRQDHGLMCPCISRATTENLVLDI